MFYKIFVNEEEIGIYGHESLINFNAGISSGTDDDGKQWGFIKPSTVCKEDDKKYLIEWPFYYPKIEDIIKIVPTLNSNISEPERKYEMGKT